MTSLQRNLVQRINVGDALTRSVAARPDHLAIVDGPRRWTYAELNGWVNRFAAGLLGRGYARGDVVALASGNSAEFLVTYLACAKTGMVCVPINLGWRPDEVAYVLEHSQARAMVVEAQIVDAQREALTKAAAVSEIIVADGTGGPYEVMPDDRTWLVFGDLPTGEGAEPDVFVDERDALSYLYTSGTTSAPKGVVASHVAIYVESLQAALDSGWSADDRFVAMLPMFHTAQLNAFCTPAITVGATMWILRGFEAAPWLELIERERITQVFGLPMMYRAALDDPGLGDRDLSSLRRAVYAMAPMPEELIRRCLKGFDCDFSLLFGQTEMSPCTTLFRPEHQLSHIGAVGTPITGVQVGIMAPDGTLLPRGGEGEIVYRGPSTMTGYLANEAATDEAFAHGWFHSGDVGRMGDDGVLWFTDRYKDVIKTGGENVASLEVERAVYDADDGVAEVAVVGLPHARWSEAITAVVVAKPGRTVSEESLTAALRSRLDAYKLPKAVVVVDALPKTSTGKVRKQEVRADLADLYRS